MPARADRRVRPPRPTRPAVAYQRLDEQVARWGGRVLQVYAVWLLLSLLLKPLFAPLDFVIARALSATGIPSNSTLFSAVLVGLIASGFLRRRRVALWFVVIAWQLPAVLAVPLALFVNGSFHGTHWSLFPRAGIALVLMVLLISARRAFPARLVTGAWWLSALIVVTGVALTIGLGLSALFLVRSRFHGFGDRLAWSIDAALGLPLHTPMFDSIGHGPPGLRLALGMVSGVSLVAAIVVYLRAAPRNPGRDVAEELEVRRLLLEHPGEDSLAYLATRDDRAAVFSHNRRAAVSYRVVNGVALAAADPIGDPVAWPDAVDRFLEHARRYGWAPGVISASEEGARVYRAAGMGVVVMGDEAIVRSRDFDLRTPALRAVRDAINRPRREGYDVRIRRARDVSPDEFLKIREAADLWLGGEVERGFSMALDRLGSPRDPQVVIVTAHASDGELRGLLTFIPWGRRGASLDCMRRSPFAVPGVNELMISTLAAQGSAIGIDRVSLNFAMFRGIIEQGEAVTAGPVQRLLRRAILVASRWWQLDSLYRANQKYRPHWRTRYLCYAASAQLTSVIVSSAQAEGFIPMLPPLRRYRSQALSGTAADAEIGAKVREQEDALMAPLLSARRLTDQESARRRKIEVLEAAGMEAYPATVPRSHPISAVDADLLGETVSVSGRVVRLHDFGGVCFATLREEDAERQVLLEASGRADIGLWRRAVDLGDHVSVTGRVDHSRSGKLSVCADSWVMAAKALKPLPDRLWGASDPESRLRLRSMDLALSTESSTALRRRSAAIQAMRSVLLGEEFLEVETPILQQVHGGANARPFRTYINAYGMGLYLRIAPELFLKRLAMGGMERVFEIGKNFRNEGADATHNPEFTSLEAYQAFADYTTMRHLARELVIAAAVAVHGEPIARRPDGATVPLDGEWPVVAVHDAVSRAVGGDVTPGTPAQELIRLGGRAGVRLDPGTSQGAMVNELYDRLVEGATVEPTFYVDFPVETSPLTRVHRVDPRLAERWDLVAFGMELGTAYSELTDPVDQRRRLTEQSLLAAAGDPEAMEVDEDFLSALEFGFPPTGGLGMGVDRVHMMLIGASIRETLAFPFVKPDHGR